MPYQRAYDPEHTKAPACIHLRSKHLIVAGKHDPSELDDLGSTPCWCNLTQHVLGPDATEVERTLCVPGRKCFRDKR